MQRPHIIVFDQAVAARSPAGSCVLAEIRGLASAFQLTVFSDRCDAAQEPGIEWVRVPLPRGPLILRYVMYQLLAPLSYWRWRTKAGAGARIAHVQSTGSQFTMADFVYAHFCHRAYLRGPWKQSSVTGLRKLARWLNHSFNAYFEPSAFAGARCIVVPSHGLARELAHHHPVTRDKIVVLANPVDTARFSRPPQFDRESFRRSLGMAPQGVVFAFMALGDFARKGLGLIIEALAALSPPLREQSQLLVIGGGPAEISEYRDLAKAAGLSSCVHFVGMQTDVRPYLWASDVFAFPSTYEIFSLAILQAAAAGLPAIVTEGLYGAEEFVVHRQNGWVAPRTAEAVRDAMADALDRGTDLVAMSRAAVKSVEKYGADVFVDRWRELYSTALPPRSQAPTPVVGDAAHS